MKVKTIRNIWIRYFIGIAAVIAVVFFLAALFSSSYPYFIGLIGINGTWKYSEINIGEDPISLYWIIMLISFIIAAVFFVKRRSIVKLNIFQALLSNVILFILSYIGAKILYTLESWDYVKEYGLSFGGVSFFGTVFFVPLVIPWFGWLFDVEAKDYLDFITPAGILYLSLLRIDCFVSGCCGGITVHMIGKAKIPTQLIECILGLIVLMIILDLEYEKKYRGGRYFLFMGYYGLIRFLLEFVRVGEKLGNTIFSRSQIFALISMCIGLTYYLIKRPVKAKKKKIKK